MCLKILLIFSITRSKGLSNSLGPLLIEMMISHRKKQLLLSIPGIGEKTAHTILGELLFLDSFENARQVALMQVSIPDKGSLASSKVTAQSQKLVMLI